MGTDPGEEAKRLAGSIVEHCIYCDRWQNDPESKCAKHIRAERDEIAAALAARDAYIDKIGGDNGVLSKEREGLRAQLADFKAHGHDECYEQANWLKTRLAVAEKERDKWKIECQRRWAELNSLRPERDEEGDYCYRCGLRWEASKDDKHQCPPGFWNEYEKETAKLKSDLESLKDILAAKEIYLMDLHDALAGWVKRVGEDGLKIIELEAERDMWARRCNDALFQRDAAEVKGMERAKVAVEYLTWRWMQIDNRNRKMICQTDAINAIDAEIAKLQSTKVCTKTQSPVK